MIEFVDVAGSSLPAVALRGVDGRAALLAIANRTLQCALQPIVDVNTGVVHAVEALMRGHDGMGYSSPLDLLDLFFEAGAIAELEELLHGRAIEAFIASPLSSQGGAVRLFVNVDGRALTGLDNSILERTVGMITTFGLPPSVLCVELSERHERFTTLHIERSIHNLKILGVRFAADDFGKGHSELKLLFDQCVDYLKVDQYFIAGINLSERKKIFFSNICRFAHVMGVRVIAEGVETASEFETCRDLGCDFIQGWFVACPQIDPSAVLLTYPHIAKVATTERRLQARQIQNDGAVQAAMKKVPSVQDTSKIGAVFDLFRSYPDIDLCVVVDAAGEPRGTISEVALRPFVYNRYGRDLLLNRGMDHSLSQFINACPSVDVWQTMLHVLDIFIAHPGAGGVIVTESGKYQGILTAQALLTMANERYLTEALDRNPLTHLPGNAIIANRISSLATEMNTSSHKNYLCYFDFDNFKPFNDLKGFRQGDRVIVLFAETMLRHFPDKTRSFLGHLGGDDFVGVFESDEQLAFSAQLLRALNEFAETAANFYTAAERACGYTEGVDRFATVRQFPLLRCSVGVIEFLPLNPPMGSATVDRMIASLKMVAKANKSGMAWDSLPVSQ